MKLCFLDVETTGVNFMKHGIIQIGCQIEIDDKLVDEFEIKVKPFPDDVIEDSALKINKLTREKIDRFPEPEKMHAFLINKFNKHVNRYKKRDKFFFVGYNSQAFDMQFMRQWFRKCGDTFFGSWFWSASLDVMILSADKVKEQRHTYPNWKLCTAAEAHGIEMDDDKAHDALYDVKITRELYHRVTAKEVVDG